MASNNSANPQAKEMVKSLESEERRRRMLLLILLILMAVLCWVGYLFLRYLIKPQPLANILVPPQVAIGCYPPTYKFSIGNVIASSQGKLAGVSDHWR